MYHGNTTLAVITARGGSKGIPKKNIKELGGTPLIAWTIEAVKGAHYLTECIVSTDDTAIADVCRHFGARVPFMRPPALATDSATSISVVQHALTWMKENEGKEFDYLMILQPTSPFRTTDDIDASIKMIVDTGADSVMGMKKLVDFSAAKLKRIDEDGHILPWLEEEGSISKSRNELPPVYKRNCAIYLTKTSLIMTGDMFGGDSRAYVMPEERSIDINTPCDFALAEVIATQVKT